jgi:hypothetical protein
LPLKVLREWFIVAGHPKHPELRFRALLGMKAREGELMLF